MTSTPKNGSALGIFLLVLLAAGQQPYGPLGSIFRRGFPHIPGSLSSLGQNPQLVNFARDMHRMVDMMDQVANVSQYVLPRDSSHIGGAIQSIQQQSLPDLQQLMEMAGPLMAMLGNASPQK